MDGSLVIIEAFIVGCALGPILWAFAFEVNKRTIFTCIGVITATLLFFNTSWAGLFAVIFLVEACLTLSRCGRTMNYNERSPK